MEPLRCRIGLLTGCPLMLRSLAQSRSRWLNLIPSPILSRMIWHPENWGLIPGNERSKLTRAYNKADKAGDAEARQAVVEEAKKAATGAASAGVTVTADTNQESSTPAQTEGAS